MKGLRVNDRVTLPARELSWSATRASGPGGQHVNKVATKVVLRFDLDATQALTPIEKRRLRKLAGRRIDGEGALVIAAQAERSQSQNLERARETLRRLVARALVKPKSRIATQPSAAQRRRRLRDKRHQSEKKRRRAPVSE